MSSPGPPPAAPTFEASKCAWIMARAVASFIENLPPGRGLAPGAGCRAAAQMVLASGGARACCGPPVPAMEGRPVARVPGIAQSGGAEVPVGADLGGDRPQVVPEVRERGASPEPVAVVDLLDVEVLLDHPSRVLEERPLGADGGAELLERVMVVGCDRGDLGVGDGDLRIVRGELEVLLVLLGAVVAARERQDERVVA